MDKFELINIEDFVAFCSEDTDDSELINYKICPQCNINMTYKISNEYICEQCGLSKGNVNPSDDYNTAGTSNYNTLNNSGTPVKCVGNNSFKFQCLLRNNSSYSIIQENNIKNTLFRLNYNSTNITDLNIPKDILLSVNEQYKLIRKSHNIYRGQILRGILASLTYYECLKQKLTHKPREIAMWFEIDSTNLSKGDKILRTLNEDGVINLDIDNIDANNNFIYSYMMRLEIDKEYLPFLYELLEQVDKLKIINPNSKSSTKAISILYLLIICKNMPITQDMLYEQFKISISTFKSMTNAILKQSDRLIDIFKKYNIPQLKAVPRSSKPRKNTKKV